MTTLLQSFITQVKENITEISNAELQHKINKQEDFLLLDVRSNQDWDAGHLPNAVNCDKGLLEIKIEKIAPDINQEIVIYCGGGTRSALAADSLQKMGYKNVKSLAGGFRGWKEESLPVE